jgi:hypothetical protein
MTDSQRTALVAEIQRRGKLMTKSKEAALEALIQLGVVTADGQLTPEYGGPERAEKAAA